MEKTAKYGNLCYNEIREQKPTYSRQNTHKCRKRGVSWKTKSPEKNMDRYKWILVEMESRPNSSMTDPLKSIELTKWEKEKFMDALGGEIYTMPSQRRNYILQRLDSFVSDSGAIYNAKVFTGYYRRFTAKLCRA